MNAPLQHRATVSADGLAPFVVNADFYSKLVGAGFLRKLKVELRDGVIIQMNAQYVPHLRAKGDLWFALREAVIAIDPSLRVDTEGSVRLGDYDVPEPDIIVWRPDDSQTFVNAPTVLLVVEVSDTTLVDDLGRKARLYSRGEIPEYWVLDVNARVLHRHSQPTAEGYEVRSVVRFGETVGSAVIPGLALTLLAIGIDVPA